MSVLDFTFRLRGSETLSKTGKSAAGGMKLVARETSVLRDEQKKLGAVKADIDKFKGLKLQARQTGQRLEDTRAETKRLAREMKASENPTAALTKKFNQNIAASRHLKNVHEAETKQLERLRDKLNASGISTKTLAGDSRNLASQSEKLTRALEKQARAREELNRLDKRAADNDERLMNRTQLAGNMSFIAGSTGQVGSAMRRGLGDTMAESMTFESALADINKVVDFKEANGLKRLGAQLRSLSADEIPIAKEGLAQIAAQGGQMGIGEDQLLDFTRTAAKMSIAFDVLPEEAGQAMATLSNVLGIPIQDIEALGDAINQLSDNTPAKAKQITEALLRSGGMGKLFGLDPPEIAALNASLIAMGKRPEVAATGINAMLIRMQAATKQTPAFRAALDSIGMSAEGMEQAVARDAQGTLLDFLETLEGYEGSERVGLLSDLFGMEYADDISLLVGSLDVYRDALKEVSDTEAMAGSMQREFANRSATAANEIQLLRGGVANLKTTLGDSLMPTMGGFITMARDTIGAITNWAEENPKLAGGLMMVALAATAIVTAAVPMITLLAAGVGTWAMYTYVIEKASIAKARNAVASGVANKGLWSMAKGALPAAIAGVKGLTVALMTNPIGLIVAGIAVAGLLLVKYWKPVSAFFKGVFKGIAEGLGPIAGVIASSFAPVAGIFKTVIGWVSRLFGPVEMTADGLAKAGNAGAVAGRVIAGAIKLILSPITLVLNLVGMLWHGIKAVFSWSPVETLKAAWSGLGNLVGGLIDGFKGIAARGWGHIKTILSWSPLGLVGRAWSGLGGILRRVTGRAKEETGKAWRGIKAMVAWSPDGTLRKAWASAGDVLKTAFRKMFGIAQDGMKQVAGTLAKPLKGVAKAFGIDLGFTAKGDAKKSKGGPDEGDDSAAPKRPPAPMLASASPIAPTASATSIARPVALEMPNAITPQQVEFSYDVSALEPSEIDFNDFEMPMPSAVDGGDTITIGDVTIKIDGANHSISQIADEVVRKLKTINSGAHYDGE